MFTAAPALTGGNTTQTNKGIFPYAVGDTSATGTGISFVTYNINPANNTANTTGIRPLDTATEYSINPAAITAGDNIEVNAAYSTNANSTLNSLLITGGVAWSPATAGTRAYTISKRCRSFHIRGEFFGCSRWRGAALAFAANEGILTIAGTSNLSLSTLDRMTGTGGLTKTGAGTVTFNRANTFTGTTTVDAGTFAWGASNIIANADAFNVNGGTVALGAFSDTVGAVTLTDGSITSTTGVLTGTNYTVQNGLVSAILGGNGTRTLTKTTTGTVTLSGANTYAGATTISAGTLVLGSTAALGTAAAGTSVAAGATLDLNGFTLGTAEALTLNGTGVGGGGALTNSSATAATYSGLITLGSASSIVANNGNIVFV